MADDKDDTIAKKMLERKIAEIKSIVKNIYTQTQLDTNKNKITSLLSFIDPAVLQALLLEAEEKKNNYTMNLVSDREREQAEQYQNALILKKIEEEHEKEVTKIYNKFDSFSPQYLTHQREENKDIEEALKATESGKGISEELKEKIRKSQKPIEEEQKLWEEIEKTRVTAQGEHTHHSNKIKEIDENLSKLHPNIHAETIKDLHKKKKHHQGKQEAAQAKLREVEKHDQEREKYAEALVKAKSTEKQPAADKDFWKEEEDRFKAINKIAPEKLLEKAKKKNKEKEEVKSLQANKKTMRAELGKDSSVVDSSKPFTPSKTPAVPRKNQTKGIGGRL